jgi:hypothetical protein
MKLQCLENLNKILAFLKEKGVRLENIGGEDIHAGHSMLTLGLIWTIILRIQISEIEGADAKNYKAALLAVCCANLDPSRRWKQRCGCPFVFLVFVCTLCECPDRSRLTGSPHRCPTNSGVK